MKHRFIIGLVSGVVLFLAFIGWGWMRTDYKDGESLLEAYDAGEDIVGKTAFVDVAEEGNFMGAKAFHLRNEPNVYFINSTEQDPKFKTEDTLYIRVTKVQEVFGTLIIGYDMPR